MEAIKFLLQIGNFITLLSNQILYKEGQKARKFYIILYGLMGYQTKERGTFVTFGIGATVGEEWLFKGQSALNKDQIR